MKIPTIFRDPMGNEHPMELEVPDNIFDGLAEDDEQGRAQALMQYMDQHIEQAIERVKSMLETVKNHDRVHLMPGNTTLQ